MRIGFGLLALSALVGVSQAQEPAPTPLTGTLDASSAIKVVWDELYPTPGAGHAPHPTPPYSYSQPPIPAQTASRPSVKVKGGGPHFGPPQTRHYTFDLADSAGSPDGFLRRVMTINNQFPGPLIEANEGDTLVIKVNNNLDTPQAIHWHGIHQNHTNDMDGVPGVTQCSIPAHGSYTYEFTVHQYGTYFYHSHFANTMADGIVGGLVIHSRNDPLVRGVDFDDEQVLYLGDWQDDQSDTIAHGLWDATHGYRGYAVPIDPDSILFNGIGQTNCSIAQTDVPCSQKRPAEIVGVTGRRLRLRVIHMGSHPLLRLSVDNHNLTVVEADDTPIEPVTVHWLPINPGQRYSVIIDFDKGQPGDAFWMRAQTAAACIFLGSHLEGKAVIRYSDRWGRTCKSGLSAWSDTDDWEDSPSSDIEDSNDSPDASDSESPTASLSGVPSALPNEIPSAPPSDSAVPSLSASQPSATFNSTVPNVPRAEQNASTADLDHGRCRRPRLPRSQPWDDLPDQQKEECLDLDHYHKLTPRIPEEAPSSVFHSTVWNNKVGKFYNPITDNPFIGFGFNDVDYVNYINKPLLGQVEGGLTLNSTNFAYDVWDQFGAADLILNVIDPPGLSHPFHLHGRPFYIVARGKGNITAEDVPNLDLNLVNPLRRDTIQINHGEYAVLRVITDTPGVWAMHCHVGWHLAVGKMAVIVIRPDEIQKNTHSEDWYSLCNGTDPDEIGPVRRDAIPPAA